MFEHLQKTYFKVLWLSICKENNTCTGFLIWKFQLLIFIHTTIICNFCCLQMSWNLLPPLLKTNGWVFVLHHFNLNKSKTIASFLSVQYFVKIKNVIHMKIKPYVQKLLVSKLCCPKFLTFETPTNTNSTLYFQYLPSPHQKSSVKPYSLNLKV